MTLLFADSDTVAIVGAVASCITSVVAAIAAIYIARINKGQNTAAVLVQKVAEKQEVAVGAVLEVKTTLETSTARQEEKINGLITSVEAVHKATNSLTDRLVEKTEAEALVRGGVEERARADALKPKGK